MSLGAGLQHCVALTAGGSILAWGSNNYGQTNTPAGLSNVAVVAAGHYHNLALITNGTVVAWGDNSCAQTNVPPGLTNIVAVAAGSAHSMVLRAVGTVAAWGWNNSGQTNVPAGLTNVLAIAAGASHCLALRANGTVVAWGDNSYGQTNVPATLTNVVSIAAGASHCLAVRANGAVVAWGDNSYGQTNVPAGLANVSTVAGGVYHSLARCKDGTTVAWGDNSWNQTDVPGGLASVVGLAAGEDCSLSVTGVGRPVLHPVAGRAIMYAGTQLFLQTHPAGEMPLNCLWQKDGTPVPGATDALLTLSGTNASQSGVFQCVVYNPRGTITGAVINVTLLQLEAAVSPQRLSILLTNPVALSTTVEGSVPFYYQWCKDSSPIPGAIASTYSIASARDGDGGIYSVIVSNHYGCTTSSAAQVGVRNVEAWNNYMKDIPYGVSNVVAVDSGAYHETALRGDGTVVAWGSNDYGQTNVPPGLSNVVAISAGSYHTLALRTDGTVVAWGSTNYFQTNVPPALVDVIAVAAGGYHSMALQKNGSIVTWGNNDLGQGSVPPGMTNAVAFAAGTYHSLALRADGTVAAWGSNDYGQTNTPASLSNAVAVSGGAYHSLVLRADGTVSAWGWNNEKQTDVPPGLTGVVAIDAGPYHNVALRPDGTVSAWGNNSWNQTNPPANLRGAVALSAGNDHNTTVIGVGKPFFVPMATPIATITGNRIFLRAQFAGEQPLACQWLQDGVPVTAATSAVWTVTATSSSQSGNYQCVGSNTTGVATSMTVYVDIPDDIDSDQISDWWELTYFGSFTNANATSDSDGDGYSDLLEFIAGSNPTNRFSVFMLDASSDTAGDAFVLQWQSISNRYYTISRTTNLLTSGFAPLVSNLLATPPVNTYTDFVYNAADAYYTIKVKK